MYQVKHIFLLLAIIAKHTSADHLDPIEELILKLNLRSGPSTSLEHALTVQEKCNNDVKNAGDLNLKFPSPTPNDIAYNSSGFRKYGDKCNLEEEREFYNQLLILLIPKERNSNQLGGNLLPSPQFRFNQWSDHYKTWQANGTLRVCNPRWLLECGKSEGEDVCVCLSKGLRALHYTIGLEVEHLQSDGCEDTGTCKSTDDSANEFRCVAKVMDPSVSASDEDEETVSGCEINLPVFGICQIDCNLNNACTTLDPSRLTRKNAKFQNRKVCCNTVTGCLVNKEKSSGPIIRATRSRLLFSVMVLVGISNY